jgi:hypothetical protein
VRKNLDQENLLLLLLLLVVEQEKRMQKNLMSIQTQGAYTLVVHY